MNVLPLLALALGLCIGSFLNVVIWRLPRGRSLLHPGSSCPCCGHPIPAYLNLPILSYVLLRGRCRWCRSRIQWRYPLVECLTGGTFALLAARFLDDPARAVSGALLASLLIAITFIDLDHGIVPDVISLPGLALGLATGLIRSDLPVWDVFAGAAVCGGFFWLVVIVSRGGMGGGDVKLGAMIGAFCGWRLALLATFTALVTGGAAAAVLLLAGRKARKDTIPFGPFLAVGALMAYVWGDAVIGWYRGFWLPSR
jgi:leader peptidase (prepilin peptidase)/N-methyltransferase